MTIAPERTEQTTASGQVGRSMRRVDAGEKLRGEAQYVGDMIVPGMLHGKVLRSPVAHARIVSIDASEALAMPGVVCVLTGEDFADQDQFWGHALKDRPIVAAGVVRFVGEPVAAVAAVDEATAEAAVKAMETVSGPSRRASAKTGTRTSWNASPGAKLTVWLVLI